MGVASLSLESQVMCMFLIFQAFPDDQPEINFRYMHNLHLLMCGDLPDIVLAYVPFLCMPPVPNPASWCGGGGGGGGGGEERGTEAEDVEVMEMLSSVVDAREKGCQGFIQRGGGGGGGRKEELKPRMLK